MLENMIFTLMQDVYINDQMFKLFLNIEKISQ